MSTIIQWLTRIRRQLSNILGKKTPSSLPPGVVVHDPAASSRPRDLDDPFIDGSAQSRAAVVIARAAQEKRKNFPGGEQKR